MFFLFCFVLFFNQLSLIYHITDGLYNGHIIVYYQDIIENQGSACGLVEQCRTQDH